MAEDFSALSAAVDRAVSLITEAVEILNNSQTDNNNQSVIDALTLRLQGAADALAGAEAPAPTPAAEPVVEPVAEAAPADEAPSDAPAE